MYAFHYLSLAVAAASEGTWKDLLVEFLPQTSTAQKNSKKKAYDRMFQAAM